MAGKTKKKAAAKKPSKKAPKKAAAKKAKSAKPAKKAAPKKAAPKKAAPKQAAPKKAAPKQAAPKQAAPKKPAAAKKPAVKKPPKDAIEPAEALDTLEATESEPTADAGDAADDDDGGGIEVVEASDEPVADAGPKPSLQAEILAMARQLYGDKTDEELLALDPNDIDAMDPSMFYELLGEKYGVEADPDNDYFGGFGGPIQKLIAFVESRWDGKTRKDTPMPPGDWLEEYVHPES